MVETQRPTAGGSLFTRYPGNPILTPQDWPYPVNAVFNPGATTLGDGGPTLLLVRVEDRRGISHLTVARSPDGKSNWVVEPRPALAPHPDFPEEAWGVEDPRVVWLEEEGAYAVTYVSFSRRWPVVSLATTRDFVTFRRWGALLPPDDKDAALFPRKIRGRYALLHRPTIRGEAHVWLSFSPDLRHWGEHQVLLETRPGWWDSHRIGIGPPPLETPEGWLVIYHGVRSTVSGSLYRVGLALLDLEDPTRVLRRTDEWVFGPHEPYERVGDVPGVTFPCGAVVDRAGGELRMYYGAADSTVALATACLDDLLACLRESPPVQDGKGGR